MKKGFTLQEVLITLAVVGIVAAIATPGLVGNLPCREKMQFLKSYKEFTNIVADLADDPNAYHTTDAQQDCIIFDCTNEVVDIMGNHIVEDRLMRYEKFSILLANRFGIPIDNNNDVGNQIQFTTNDGIRWDINNANTTDISITINVAPNDNRAVFNEVNLTLDREGGITPDDIGSVLLQNPTRLKRKDVRADILEAQRGNN